MKKVFFMFALIMSMVFTMNAQTIDTIKVVDHIEFDLSELDETNLTEPVVINLDSTWTHNNGAITFDIDTLYEHAAVLLYVDEDIYSHEMTGYDVAEWYDTVYNDIVDHIDSVEIDGIYVYDTVYGIDTIMTNYDTIPVFEPMFHVGHNIFTLNGYETIDSIAFAIDWNSDDTVDYVICINNITFINNYDMLGINQNNVINAVKAYPNPVHNTIYLDGEFNKAIVIDQVGRIVYATSNHTINMAGFPAGMYFLNVDGHAIKIQKY